jgi:hypothetical protein
MRSQADGKRSARPPPSLSHQPGPISRDAGRLQPRLAPGFRSRPTCRQSSNFFAWTFGFLVSPKLKRSTSPLCTPSRSNRIFRAFSLDPDSLHAEDAGSLRANRFGRIDFWLLLCFQRAGSKNCRIEGCSIHAFRDQMKLQRHFAPTRIAFGARCSRSPTSPRRLRGLPPRTLPPPSQVRRACGRRTFACGCALCPSARRDTRTR